MAQGVSTFQYWATGASWTQLLPASIESPLRSYSTGVRHSVYKEQEAVRQCLPITSYYYTHLFPTVRHILSMILHCCFSCHLGIEIG